MKRTRFFALLLTAVMILAIVPFSAVSAAGKVWDGSVASSFASGSGTEDDPYIITTGAELAYLGEIDTEDLYFELGSDIILNDTSSDNWYEDANSWFYFEFYGNFDGKGYTVSGVCVNPEDTDGYEDVGLFPYAEGATIMNLNVEDSYIVGCEDVGGIVGEAHDCYIYNCTFDGVVKSLGFEYTNSDGETITSGGGYAGGIVGYAWNDSDFNNYIEECINYGDVYTTSYDAGGIAGLISTYVVVVGCENYGDVCGDNCVGGIVGDANGYYREDENGELAKEYSNIISCVNKGTVSSHSSDGYYVGGIVGYSDIAEIMDCYNFSDIHAYSEVGGIVGYANSENTIVFCANYGEISGNYYIGGIIGETYGNTKILSDDSEVYLFTSLEMCVNHGDVVGVYDEENDSESNCIGGIIGSASYGSVIYSYNYGDISGYRYVGGIIGCIDESVNVLNCYNNANVIATYENAGGIAGAVDIYYNDGDVYFINCTNKGYVYSEYTVGGIVGYAYCSNSNINISGCQNKGIIEGICCVGGIGGYVVLGVIEDCLNDGHIIIAEDVNDDWEITQGGGILGESDGVTLENCISTGTVDSANATFYGGLIGIFYDYPTIINCYYLDTTADFGVGADYTGSDIVISDKEYEGSKGISASEMKTQATFTDFDFESIWAMDTENPQLVIAEKSILGDVNLDDVVDKKDYAIVKRVCFGTTELELGQNLSADANGDGIVDKKDYALIKRNCFGTAEIK